MNFYEYFLKDSQVCYDIFLKSFFEGPSTNIRRFFKPFFERPAELLSLIGAKIENLCKEYLKYKILLMATLNNISSRTISDFEVHKGDS